MPVVLVCVWKVCALSTSDTVIEPVVVMAAFVSTKRALFVPVKVAASLLPWIATLTVRLVPSSVVTVKVSVRVAPATFSWFTAVLALSTLKLHVPFVPIVYVPCEVVPVEAANKLAVLSTSVDVNVPVYVAAPTPPAPASVTVPAVAPPTVAASLLPWIRTLTVWLVPSTLVTVNVSTIDWPPFKACTCELALSNEKFHAPFVPIVYVPCEVDPLEAVNKLSASCAAVGRINVGWFQEAIKAPLPSLLSCSVIAPFAKSYVSSCG